MDCLFCKIALGEIPSNTIYEDDTIKCFYDIDPKAPIHFLVIPKKHIASPADIKEEDSQLIGHIFATIAKIATDLNLENGYRVVTNCGKDAGQSVGHLHFHILAKRSLAWPPG